MANFFFTVVLQLTLFDIFLGVGKFIPPPNSLHLTTSTVVMCVCARDKTHYQLLFLRPAAHACLPAHSAPPLRKERRRLYSQCVLIMWSCASFSRLGKKGLFVRTTKHHFARYMAIIITPHIPQSSMGFSERKSENEEWKNWDERCEVKVVRTFSWCPGRPVLHWVLWI